MSEQELNFKIIKNSTKSVYQNHALVFDKQRSRSLMERSWLDRFIKGLPPGGSLLDLGCGTGDPVSAYLAEQGFRITGVDYAPAMIEVARQRYPDQTWLIENMCQLKLPQKFDGVLSWNGFFHLSPEEQIVTLPRLADLTKPGGSLMLTVGDRGGEVTGTVANKPVYHSSLDEHQYRDILAEAGFSNITFCPNDPDCGGHSILMAQDRNP